GATGQRQGGEGGEAGGGNAEAELAEVGLGHSTQVVDDASSVLFVRISDNELAHNRNRRRRGLASGVRAPAVARSRRPLPDPGRNSDTSHRTGRENPRATARDR